MTRTGTLRCLLAAALFGATAPAAAELARSIPTFTLAGLLYLGAALAVAIGARAPPPPRRRARPRARARARRRRPSRSPQVGGFVGRHAHPHRHGELALAHAHPHVPDLHRRHEH